MTLVWTPPADSTVSSRDIWRRHNTPLARFVSVSMSHGIPGRSVDGGRLSVSTHFGQIRVFVWDEYKAQTDRRMDRFFSFYFPFCISRPWHWKKPIIHTLAVIGAEHSHCVVLCCSKYMSPLSWVSGCSLAPDVRVGIRSPLWFNTILDGNTLEWVWKCEQLGPL